MVVVEVVRPKFVERTAPHNEFVAAGKDVALTDESPAVRDGRPRRPSTPARASWLGTPAPSRRWRYVECAFQE